MFRNLSLVLVVGLSLTSAISTVSLAGGDKEQEQARKKDRTQKMMNKRALLDRTSEDEADEERILQASYIAKLNQITEKTPSHACEQEYQARIKREEEGESAAHFGSLPRDVSKLIASPRYLDPSSYVKLRGTCRYFRDTLEPLQAMAAELQGDQIPEEFREIGRRAYKIIGRDDSGKLHAYALSEEFSARTDGAGYTHYETTWGIDDRTREYLTMLGFNPNNRGTCDGRGGLMTKEQQEALQYALNHGVLVGLSSDSIQKLSHTYVWSLLVHPDNPYGTFVLSGYYGIPGTDPFESIMLRCVRALPSW